MKHYIFLTIIAGSGGVQCYVAAKAKYLEDNGWHVVAISDSNPYIKDICKIESLTKYVPYGEILLGFHPCQLPRCLVGDALNKLERSIGEIGKEDEVIIESWNSETAMWGELLAERLHCRHVFFTMNEHYRNKGNKTVNLYEEKIDFFKFKMDRGEILATVPTVNRLFEGYRTYQQGDFIENVISEAPIQDVIVHSVESLKHLDWNVCYIGRTNKPYVPNIFNGIGKFAKNHPEKTIHFVIVGEIESNKEYLDKLLEIENLTVTELGDLFPIPRNLYKKIDVVIAGSGSARHSADEDALVIIADTELKNSHGLLGYDTNASIFRESEDCKNVLDLTFDEALERALVERAWIKMPNKWKKERTVEQTIKLQLDIIHAANPSLEYYDREKLLDGKKEYIKAFKRLVWVKLTKFRNKSH